MYPRADVGDGFIVLVEVTEGVHGAEEECQRGDPQGFVWDLIIIHGEDFIHCYGCVVLLHSVNEVGEVIDQEGEEVYGDEEDHGAKCCFEKVFDDISVDDGELVGF